MNDTGTYYSVQVKPLAGKSVVTPGDLTTISCKILVAEIRPGILLRFAIDTCRGIMYVDSKAELTW